MAVTHADLAPSRRSTDLGSKTGALLPFMLILCTTPFLCRFIDNGSSSSSATWVTTGDEGTGKRYECTYSGSGKTPLLCAAGAFLGLAIAMVVAHVYLMVAVSKSPPPALCVCTRDKLHKFNMVEYQHVNHLFIVHRMSFAVGEILLLIALSIESGHLKDYSTPRPSCLILNQGVFSAAGVFSLVTVFLAAGLYITALRAQCMLQDQENVRREVMEAAMFHTSPPRSPAHRIAAVSNENPVVIRGPRDERTLGDYLSVFSKQSSLA
ncbi:hypothetical protein RHSIM_Rhsim04G0232200 [Rhododendron simsii]|uniref:Uncharacterized protein n=1 Tax=Rhododendron simsii TaxID=118357 RepID=A0A834LU03_RHOSS|nr:hypothetical protein RHSIM_Rhsim04G0232200 [Rhododendron simsii]